MFGTNSLENSSEDGTDSKTVRLARGTYARNNNYNSNSNNGSLNSLEINGSGSNENLAGIVNTSGADAAANAGKTVKKVTRKSVLLLFSI
jgi:hypothetical protein